MSYKRLTTGLIDKGKLIPKSDDVYNYMDDSDQDYYESIYQYNQEQLERFEKTGSVAGITEVETNRLIWDFDAENDVEKARQDTLSLCYKLIEDYEIKPDEMNIFFSGNKGFGVEVKINSMVNTNQFRDITQFVAEGLETFDTTLWDANQLIRIPGTKHQKSGLFKTCISIKDLSDCTVEQIKELAMTQGAGINLIDTEVVLPSELNDVKNNSREVSARTESYSPEEIEGPYEEGMLPDLSKKPRNVPTNKWLLVQGFVKPGNKHQSMMALAAYYKNLGYNRDSTHNLIKAAFRVQHRLFPDDSAVPKEHVWKAVSDVYSPNWQGGVYSETNHKFLVDNCRYFCGTDGEMEKVKTLVSISEVADKFSKYARDIDKNTVKTGIKPIDDNIRLQTGSHVVLAGCSGSGKTTLILNILNNLSKTGLSGMFGSMDMNSNLIYQKLVQRVSGMNDNELYQLWKDNNKSQINKYNDMIDNEFKNIKFDFRSGIEIDSLRENILEAKARLGDGMKLVVLDFINRIRGPYSDETANLSYIAPRLSDLANESETLILSLAQIARHKGGPSTELTDSRVAKGSSAIEESATVLFGIWRPGYNDGVNDKYMCMSALKTRMGKEFTKALHFNGLTSEIRGLNPDEQIKYEKYLDDKEEKKKEDNSSGGYGGF